MNQEGMRFVLMRNMELDPNIPQTFQIEANKPVEALLERWATANKVSASEFAFFTESGYSIEECRFISDIPLLAPNLNYVDIKCVKTNTRTLTILKFQVYGYPDLRTKVGIAPSIGLEGLKDKVRNGIPCIHKRRFRLLSESLQPFSSTTPMIKQLSDESRMCWIDLQYTIKCLDFKRGEMLTSQRNGTDPVRCLLRQDSPQPQQLVFFDKLSKAHVIDETLRIGDLPIEDITETGFSILLVTLEKILVDDPYEEDLELIPVNVWPMAEVKTIHQFRQRRNHHEEIHHICFDGKRLDPTMLFCEILQTEAYPILHLSKEVEIRFCDQSSELYSVFLYTSATVLDLRTSIKKKLNIVNIDEIVLKYNGFLLDCNDALLYEFNIRDQSLIHVQYARLCVLANKSNKQMSLGYHHELQYSRIFKLACKLFEKSLSPNTVFTCKCGRQLSYDEDQQSVSVDCCRPRHQQMVLTAYHDITVRFSLRQESTVFLVSIRNDETVGAATDKFFENFPITERENVQFVTQSGFFARKDLNQPLYLMQTDDSDDFVVPFEKKVILNLCVKQRTLNWTVWPSDFVSTVLTDVNKVIKRLNYRKVESWMYRNRKITEPRDREYLEFLRFFHLRVQQKDNRLIATSSTGITHGSQNLKKSTKPHEISRPRDLLNQDLKYMPGEEEIARQRDLLNQVPPPLPRPLTPINPNINISIGDQKFQFEVFEKTDSAASLIARLCKHKKIWNGCWVEPPNGSKIFPYEKKWCDLLMDKVEPNLTKTINVGEAVSIRFIVIAISPVGSPTSFPLKSTQKTMAPVEAELKQRNLRKANGVCWYTQVGRWFQYDTKKCHGVATVIGNSPHTSFISDEGEFSPKHFKGSVTISNIAATREEPSLTVPPFGDPKMEVYMNVVFLKAPRRLDDAPKQMPSMEECFTNDAFVYIRGIRLSDSKVLCPSLHSGKNVNSTTGMPLKPDDKAENFVMVFDRFGVMPKMKIPSNDDIRVFYRSGWKVTMKSNGCFVGERQIADEPMNRWIADDRVQELSRSIGRYLKLK